jgi:hypothetical protein
MWPKEHGAYGQIAFPMAAAFLAAGVSAGGLLIAVAAVAGFLGHEPAAVLLGARGPRAARAQRLRATRWLTSAALVVVAAGTGAVLAMPPSVRWSLGVPLAPAILLALATVRGREKTWVGETAAALAFSGAAVPVSLAASAPVATGVSVAIPFALLFVASTLAVRVVILRVRAGGNARAAAATRRAALAVVVGGVIALAAIVASGLLPASILIAAAPGLLTASAMAMYPPAPHHLRALGWTLVLVSAATAAIVVVTA